MLEAIALVRALLGDRPGAEAAHLPATTIADELGQGRPQFLHTYLLYALDDFPDAVRLARTEAADLERRGETGRRSTMVGLEAWMLALTGEDDDRAARAAGESRRLGALDDAVTQILWRAAECVVLARRGEARTPTDSRPDGSMSPWDRLLRGGPAWLARAHVLSIMAAPQRRPRPRAERVTTTPPRASSTASGARRP